MDLLNPFAVAVLLAAGQVLFKYGAMAAPPVQRLTDLPGLLLNGPVLLALGIYGVATVLWLLILKTLPLTVAYPFMALGFVLVPLCGILFFREPLTLNLVAGTVLILCGLVLTSGLVPLGSRP